MALSNCLFSQLLKIPHEFLTWRVLVKFGAKPRNYSYSKPLTLMPKKIEIRRYLTINLHHKNEKDT